MEEADGFLLIGDSGSNRFPATSFNCYTKIGKRFYCLDMDGLAESRGFSKGQKVYTSVDELPEERGDLAILWVHPYRAHDAVSLAHKAGATKVWFSFGTCSESAFEHAKSLDMEIVEIGRCPVFFLGRQVGPCRIHTAMVGLSGARKLPPQTDFHQKRRELV